MAWPTTLYVGTANLGVYTCSDFDGPDTQPTWTAINGGLPSTSLRWFGLDPFDSTILYCLLLGGDFYRKVGAADWSLLFTAAQQRTLVGVPNGKVYHCCVDPLTESVLYAMFHPDDTGSTQALLRSTDRGETWAVFYVLYSGAYTYAAGGVTARGDYVHCAHAGSPFPGSSGGYMTMTDDGGDTWHRETMDGASTPTNYGQMHPLRPGVSYYRYFTSGTTTNRMKRMSIAEQTGLLLDLNTHSNHDQALWFSASDGDHMRVIYNGILRETEDDFATVSATNNLAFRGGAVVGPDAYDEDRMFVGATGSLYGGHTVVALVGMAGTPVGISGANVSSSPYTDSIPDTSGGVCMGGLQYEAVTPGRWYLHGCAYTEVTP